MSEKISIMIVDDNTYFRTNLEKYINQQEDMEVVKVAKDGNECIDYLKDEEVDVVLLDIIMPHLDGIGVLEKISEMEFSVKPTFIMISAISQDRITKECILLGADYYFIKPIDIKSLIKRIRKIRMVKVGFESVNGVSTNMYNGLESLKSNKNIDVSAYDNVSVSDSRKNTNKLVNNSNVEISGRDDDKDIELIITNLIRDLGVSANIAGYNFLRDAILISLNENNSILQITKIIYPQIAIKYRVSPSRVERGIRNAIESVWKKGNNRLIQSLFGYSPETHEDKPKNSEFISAITDRLRIEFKRN